MKNYTGREIALADFITSMTDAQRGWVQEIRTSSPDDPDLEHKVWELLAHAQLHQVPRSVATLLVRRFASKNNFPVADKVICNKAYGAYAGPSDRINDEQDRPADRPRPPKPKAVDGARIPRIYNRAKVE